MVRAPKARRRSEQMTKGSRVRLIALALLTVCVALVSTSRGKPQDKPPDKYTLKSPSGIAFSDFKGYEDWAVVSSARTDEVLKVIVANPTMINAYKAGVPGNG